MKNDFFEYDCDCDSFVKSICDNLNKNGCKTERFSDGNEHMTTAYDCIVVKTSEGKLFTLTVDQVKDYHNPRTGKFVRAEDQYEI